jgi:hypothetical protein
MLRLDSIAFAPLYPAAPKPAASRPLVQKHVKIIGGAESIHHSEGASKGALV